MTKSYEIRVYSSIGMYPPTSIDFGDSQLIVDENIIFSISPALPGPTEEYLNLSGMTISDIRLTSACLLGSYENMACLYLYPLYNSTIDGIDFSDVFSSKSKNLIKERLIKRLESRDTPQFDQHYFPTLGGIKYNLLSDKFMHERYIASYQAIDCGNMLLLRGLKSLVRSKMLSMHHYLEEAAIMMYVAAEALLASEVEKIKKQSGLEIKIADLICKLENQFPNELKVAQGMMQIMNDHRVKSLHPKSRFGTHLHPGLEADDYYDYYHWLVKIYEYLLLGNLLSYDDDIFYD